MRKFAMLFVFLILVFIFALPVFADEATPEPVPDAPVIINIEQPDTSEPPTVVIPPEALPDRDEAVSTSLLLVLGFGAVFGIPILVALFVLAWNHTPAWAQGLILENRGWIEARVDEGTDMGVALARRTPNTLDDQVAGYIDVTVDDAVRRFFDERAASSSSGNVGSSHA